MKKDDIKRQGKKESENKSNIVQDKLNIYIKSISDNIKNLQKYYIIHLSTKEKDKEKTKEKINLYFSQINSTIKLLSDENDIIKSKYESLLNYNEQKIRILYSDIFNLKIKNNFLENNIDILLKKEKEYKLVKEKTGILVENGKIVYNDRKENEIIILRVENSNLKDVINRNEKVLLEINENFKKEKDNYDKQILNLNHQINQLKYKLKQSNPKLKGKSFSSININTNDTTNPNLKLNFTVNNSSNKINNSNNNEISSNKNNNNINNKRKYESILLNKKSGKIINIANSERKSNALIHWQSSGHLDLKNKMINKLKKNKQNETATTKELNLSNLNVSPIHSKKVLCLTPHNNNDNSCLNFQTFQKIADIKNKKQLKVINKNCKIKKRCLNNQNIHKSNNLNGLKVIFKNTSKIKSNNKSNNNKSRHNKIKKELTWSQNILINNSAIPNSNPKINKVKKIIINNNNNKELNKTNIIGKSPKSNFDNDKRKKHLTSSIIGNQQMIKNKSSVNSIRRKNSMNKSNSYNKKIFNSFYSNNNNEKF